MENMDFNVTETCHVMDTYVTHLFIPLCLCALLGIVTYLAHRFFQKRFTSQHLERVHTDHDINIAQTERIAGSVKDITAELKPMINQSTETVGLSSIISDVNLSGCFEETTIYTRQTVKDTERALQENHQDSSSEILLAIGIHASLGSEIKSSEANLAAQIEKSEIVTRRTIEETEMAFQGYQQVCTTEIVSQIRKHTSDLSSAMNSSENNLSTLIEKSAIETRHTKKDTEMALKETQQDCTTAVVSHIGKNTSFLSSELKSSVNNLSALIEISGIDTRRTNVETAMAFTENEQDRTTIVSKIGKQTSLLSSELKSSENNVSAHIEKSEICTRRTIEDTEMALKENQQYCTTETVSQIGKQTSFLSSEMKSAENNLSVLFEKSTRDTRRTIEDKEMTFKENQQDCTTEIVPQIRQQTSFLSSEMKSSENNLSALIEKSTIETRRTIEDTELAFKENIQDCITETVSQIVKQTSFLSSEMKSSENNLSVLIEKSAIGTQRTLEDKEMAFKENQLDCYTEIVSQIRKQTSILSSEMKSSENNLSALIKKSAIDYRRTIEKTEMALKENQQDCTTETVSQIGKQTSCLSSEMKSSENKLSALIEKSAIYTRRTIEDKEMAFKENQQECTTEIVSQIRQRTSSLSSEMKSSENNLSALIEKSAIETRHTIEDTEMALKENQQDCTTETVSQIVKQTSFLSSEMKSSENKLSALIEKSAIDDRRTIEDTEMTLKENQQDCTTETVSQIVKQTSFLSSEMKSCENNLSAHIEKSAKDTRLTIDDTEMALKENQQDCTMEIVSQIGKNTSFLRSELKSSETNIASRIEKLERSIESLVTKDSENRTSPGQDEYLAKCQDVRERLIELYTTTKKTVSVSPLREGRDKPICDVFVQPKLSNVKIEKDGSRKKTGDPVNQYKALFYKDQKLSSRVFVQGEPGMGKTTFLTKLALDWCDAVSEHNPDNIATFSDVDTLKEFQFLFQISLRDAKGDREVIEMIKTQIIDMIYTGNKREETVKLLPYILEREKYIVTMDGLNEWVDRLNKCVLPLHPQVHTECVSVITSRPWKMADERIKDSEINSLIEIEGVIDSEDLSKKLINSLQTSDVKIHAEFIKYVNERQLMNLLTSPWLHTLLVNLWMKKMELSGSLCEINCILLDILFKNAHGKMGYFQRGNSFQCLSNTRFIQRQIDIFDALANAAFNFTFSSIKSLVFTERELLNFLSEDQLEFCLHAGVLTKRFKEAYHDAQFSFIHETVQEFMAAFHIANSKQDLIQQFRTGCKHNALEMSQTIIYLCGLDCQKANKLINCLVDDEFLKDISHGLSMYIKTFYNQLNLLTFQDDSRTHKNVLKSKHYQMNDIKRCFALSVLFQRMIIAGCIEAKASGKKEICLNCRDFTFNQNLTESDSNALKLLLLYNSSNVRSLILESNFLQISEILTVIYQSKHCLTRVKMTMTAEITKVIHHTSIQELNCIGNFDVSSCSCVLSSLSQLTYLRIEDTRFVHDIVLPETIQHIDFSKCECSSAWLCSFLITLSSLDHPVVYELGSVVFKSREGTRGDESQKLISDLRSHILSNELSNIDITLENGSKELFELLRDTSIGILTLRTADCASLASEILHTLNRLTKLYLSGIYKGRCDLKLPASLQCVCLSEGECSSEWLCSLLITLSSLEHPVECELWDVVLHSSDESHTHISDMQSEILSHDLSNIEIFVQNGSKELFELLRDTSIGILDPRTAYCVILASEILHTLNKLTKLYLRGTYTGRCDLKLPASLQCISLQEGGCSYEWLCSLLITLSSLDHPVECELWDVVWQSSEEIRGDEAHTHISDLRSQILSHDLSNIEILVENGSKELFELLRDASIGLLTLTPTDCTSLASEILHTLNKLSKLYLMGTYTGRCDLKLPASLQFISLLKGGCSYEWLCSLLITLSSLDHPVKCELWDVVLQSSEENRGNEAHTHISDLRFEILSHDLSNIEILVKHGSKELFELLSDTSIGILNLRTANCASLASEVLHTLNKLTKLYLRGIYTGRCDLRLPASLKCISLQEGECSSEWLCCLLITLSSLDHPVECVLWDVVLQTSEGTRGYESQTHISVLRFLILSHDLSNIEISVNNGSKELFELLRYTSIGILDLITTYCASLASEILHTLNKLTKLYLWGTYTGRCDLRLPAPLQCISLQKIECSSEWLCSLLITLSSLDHPVMCELLNVVLQSSEESRGDESHTKISDVRSEILSYDLSNIELLMINVSKELFELLSDTSIGILNLRTANCASLASEVLHTLNKLTKLYLRGIYTGRCDLRLPVSLQCISLQEGECSSEWLCSLLITLSSLDHPVECELWDVVWQSSDEAREDESHTYVSDLRSEILPYDLSNIEISVKNGSNELFEILHDTSIGSLILIVDDYCKLETAMRTKLSMLKEINLLGTYLTRFIHDLPQSLELINFQEGTCSLEWLYSVLIKLSTIKHHVRLDVENCFIILSNETSPPSLNYYVMQSECLTNVKADVKDSSNTNVSDLQLEMLSCDMSNIELRILKFYKERFEMLRGTSLRCLQLNAFDDVSLTHVTQNTLPAFKEIRLQGSFLTDFNLTLPPTLQLIILQEGSCSSDWLYSLLIQLSTLGHSVRVFLNEYVVLQRRESIEKDPVSLMRGADLSNVKLEVFNDFPLLYKTLTTMHITSLNMTQIEHADLLSHTLPLLNHLQQLRVCLKNYDMEMKLPECIKYVFIIYTTLSPSSLQHFVQNMFTTKHSVQCKLLFRVEENKDEYARLKQNCCELKSVDVQQFEVVNKQGTVRSAAALTLSATAGDGDDDDDKRLLRLESYVDLKPWIHYCKIRLGISCTNDFEII